MTMPKYNELFFSVLKFSADKKEHKLKDTVFALANQLQLSEEEKAMTLDSGQLVFANRIGWARTYLKKAGLIESKRRGYTNITQEGLKVLDENPPILNEKFLERYDSFCKFQYGTVKPSKIEVVELKEENLSPLERLEKAHEEINKELSGDLLEEIMRNSSEFFEKLVVDLLINMGYGGSKRDAGRAVGKVNDGGIDGIIKEDKLGLDKIYIQAKRYKMENTVGRPEIQGFVGALGGEGANKGVFITTSKFTTGAIDYANKNVGASIVLIDGEKLTDFMIEFGVGVSTKDIYKIKQLDNDYFEV